MITNSFNHKDIEKVSQKYWEKNQNFIAKEDPTKEKYYCLNMFPYPSGKLHMGHVRNYTIGDVISRYQKMLGKNVLQPMGWDAFGLPAENAAIKNKTAPADWTYQNIEYMKSQLKSLGFGYDWSREITTCDPSYYKWEQWFFTELFKRKLVYKKMSQVNWCPNDNTVLANEQVENGRCWRCDSIIEKKELAQWFIKITEYADELLSDLDQLDGWSEKVKTMQKNWIGRSEGVEIQFQLQNSDQYLNVFTTRPDTLMGVTYMGVAPDHPLIKEPSKENPELLKFIKNCKNISTTEADIENMDKLGVDTSLKVIHPISGEIIPIWAANFVLMEYGTGAVMSVPAHDQRDHEFATRYNLPIKQVVQPKDQSDIDIKKVAFVDKGILLNSGAFNDLQSDQAFTEIANYLEKTKKGKKKITYRLRDWGVSRQRYWGAPIPIKYLKDGQEIPLSIGELPIKLPTDVVIDGMQSPLKTDEKWSKTSHNGQNATLETDTFDTFMESSWYYARYCSPQENNAMLNSKAANYWLPVDQYIGGIEHAVMHLLYARFFHKLLRDIGLVNSNEPFKKLLCQGMVLADTYYYLDKNNIKQWVSPTDVNIKTENGKIISLTHKTTKQKLEYAGMSKMSKSKNNGIDPQSMIEKYGADTIRLYMMFSAPPEQTLEWCESGVEGSMRFLKRLWKIVTEHSQLSILSSFDKNNLTKEQRSIRRKTHQTIQKATDDFNRRLTFNTAISSVMELFNLISKYKNQSNHDHYLIQEALESILLILAPIIPHCTHVMWQLLGHQDAIVNAKWPQVDQSALLQQTYTMVIQVNGKVRAKIEVDVEANKQQLELLAIKEKNVQSFIEHKNIKKIIVVPKKIVNIVV